MLKHDAYHTLISYSRYWLVSCFYYPIMAAVVTGIYMASVRIDPIILYLIHLRREQRLTQKHIANLCPNISVRQIQRIEQGVSIIDLQQLHEYCDALNISLLELAMMISKHRHVTAKDIEGLAKLLPTSVRQHIYDLMIDIVKMKERW